MTFNHTNIDLNVIIISLYYLLYTICYYYDDYLLLLYIIGRHHYHLHSLLKFFSSVEDYIILLDRIVPLRDTFSEIKDKLTLNSAVRVKTAQ